MTATHPIAIGENVICHLDMYGVIKISGDDTQAFLQGQFSNDVKGLINGHCQLNSYNSPKGRMYACFYLTHIDDAYYMIVNREIIDMLLKRLRMFVMRSKVTLEDQSASHPVFGFSDTPLITSLPLPAEDKQAKSENGIVCLKIDEKRRLCFGENLSELMETAEHNFLTADNNHWRRLNIHAGVPTIFAKTQEEFVPQMVNLELIGGVSFTKGCYPGQEIVARMHYLGKLKKRMYRISINDTEAPVPGENIYEFNSGNSQSVGQIVDAQLNENSKIDALAVLQINSAEEKELRLGSVDGAKINLETLPYKFEV